MASCKISGLLHATCDKWDKLCKSSAASRFSRTSTRHMPTPQVSFKNSIVLPLGQHITLICCLSSTKLRENLYTQLVSFQKNVASCLLKQNVRLDGQIWKDNSYKTLFLILFMINLSSEYSSFWSDFYLAAVWIRIGVDHFLLCTETFTGNVFCEKNDRENSLWVNFFEI